MSEEALKAQLNALQNTNFTKCLVGGMSLIMEQSKANVHVVTGHLRDSHSVEESDREVRIVVSAEYAGIEEYGTDTREAHPYLRPALDEKSDEAVKTIAQEVDAQIKEVVS